MPTWRSEARFLELELALLEEMMVNKRNSAPLKTAAPDKYETIREYLAERLAEKGK